MATKHKKIFIYGKHAVREALLHSPKSITTVYLSPQMREPDLMALIRSNNIKTERIDAKKVSSQVEGNAPHQGIIAGISVHGLVTPFEQFIGRYTPGKDVLVYLDGVTDPHNVGTIVRASAAFGATAVLIPEHGGVQVNGTIIKTSAGAAFAIPLISVPNGQQALAELKRKGVAICGLAGEGAQSIADEEFLGATLFVLGNEAEGISGSARALCGKMLRIPISKNVESLNVASAATAALYAWSTQRTARS